MTNKIVPIVLTQYQKEIYDTQERIVIPTGAAGVGTTWGLLNKALKEANEGKLVTFIRGTDSYLTRVGGTINEAMKVAEVHSDYRYSTKSNILSVGNGKIKFVGGDKSVEYSQGVSADLVIFDHAHNEEVIKYHVLRAKQVIIGLHFYRVIEQQDQCLFDLGLVERDESGLPYKFADFVHHIPCQHIGAYKWKGYDEYKRILETSTHYDMKKLLISDFEHWDL